MEEFLGLSLPTIKTSPQNHNSKARQVSTWIDDLGTPNQEASAPRVNESIGNTMCLFRKSHFVRRVFFRPDSHLKIEIKLDLYEGPTYTKYKWDWCGNWMQLDVVGLIKVPQIHAPHEKNAQKHELRKLQVPLDSLEKASGQGQFHSSSNLRFSGTIQAKLQTASKYNLRFHDSRCPIATAVNQKCFDWKGKCPKDLFGLCCSSLGHPAASSKAASSSRTGEQQISCIVRVRHPTYPTQLI